MRNNSLKRKIAIALAVILKFYLLVFLDTGYLTVQPGSAVLVEDLVVIEEYQPDEGNLYLLTVSQQKASPILFVYSLLSTKVDLVPQELVIPPDMDLQEYYELSQEMMVNSQLKSKYVALNYAGYDAKITSEGVLVEGVLTDGSAYGYLDEGDIILAIDGEEVYFDEQVINIIRGSSIGDTLNMEINREGEIQSVEVLVGENTAKPGTPALGIWVRNKALELTTPIDIEIDTGEIGGPSAGMMFVLEIYNRLTEEDITQGLNIAGTGEIHWDGGVGAIGGMKQKVFAAEKEGAEILFCPVENYQEAITYATKIEVVAVSSLEDVFDYLDNR